MFGRGYPEQSCMWLRSTVSKQNHFFMLNVSTEEFQTISLFLLAQDFKKWKLRYKWKTGIPLSSNVSQRRQSIFFYLIYATVYEL